ncbi:endonuclease domain-containing protein [Actinomadura sp. 3N407]|uniref:endonuclease domain-containing protein n=1 Tax=Actinomadura sp. 3N407 TaxID=3457423 RepID=UPI003FCD729D
MYEGYVQYRKGHGWGRPKGRCLVCGTRKVILFPLVHDHCHQHGWVRGAIGVGICTPCNMVMATIDRGALPNPRTHRLPADAYIEHWLRCPECREIGWRVRAHCACDHAPEYRSRYECTAPVTDPPCPWIGTGFRPLPPAEGPAVLPP